MAESKFLKYQDRNNDGLIDVCEDKVVVAPIDNCPDCKPNPKAVVPSWKTKTITEPFLNERTADYQVTKVTPYTNTGATQNTPEDEADIILKGRFDEFVYEAIEAILVMNNKDTSSSTQEGVKPYVEYANYSLEIQPSARLKLLYSIPCDVLQSVIDATESDGEDEDSDNAPASSEGGMATYDALKFFEKLRKVRAGVGMYATYLKIYRATENGNLIFENGPNKGAVFFPETYGDWSGFNTGTLLYKIGSQLADFLNDHKIRMPGTFMTGFSLFGDVAREITFKFDSEHKLSALEVRTEDCGAVPIIFEGKDILSLRTKSAYQDHTAVHYLLRLDAMEADLIAREPKPWLDFFIEHTAPKVYSSINHAIEDALGEGTTGSCLTDVLAKEGKQLGQDILDEGFGLVDAILYKFNANLCSKDWEEVKAQYIKEGIIRDDVNRDPQTGQPSNKTIWALAQEQAFAELDAQNTPGDALCAGIMQGTTNDPDDPDKLEALFEKDLAKIKFCGMRELFLEAMNCLFKGLTFEEVLSRVIKAALNGMDMHNFETIFVGLPPEKQSELDALVQKKLSSDDVLGDRGAAQRASRAIEGAGATEALGTVDRPWEHPDITVEGKSPEGGGTMLEDLSIGHPTNRERLDDNTIFQAYISAVLEVYHNNLLDLLGELNQLPGADLVTLAITSFECPRPPSSSTAARLSFIKNRQESLGWKACDNTFDINWPEFKNPFGWIASQKDLWGKFELAATQALQEMIYNITIMTLKKACDVLSRASCKTLEAVGAGIAGIPDVATGKDTFKNIIKDTICGDSADDDVVDDTMLDLLANLGLGAAAFADKERAMAFIQDISQNATAQEWALAFNGEAPPTLLEIIQSIIELEYQEYRDALSNQEKMKNFFNQIGNAMPVDARAAMVAAAAAQPPLAPANPTLCQTPEEQVQFEEDRCALMVDRASRAQCKNMQPDYGAELEELAGWSQIPPLEIPNLFSDPGCDNGVFPFEPPQTTQATTVGLTGELESLKTKFTTDMLGNGPFEEDWGLFNMILSDTLGNPYTTHLRRVANDLGKQQYVDFYVDDSLAGEDDLPGNYDKVADQFGAYPIQVAEWLQGFLRDSILTYDSNNTIEYEHSIGASVDYDNHPEPISYVDLGYNIGLEINAENTTVSFIKRARKLDPDLRWDFFDNQYGYSEDGADPSQGYRFEFYMSDLIELGDGTIINRPDDNVRVKIDSLQASYTIPTFLLKNFPPVAQAVQLPPMIQAINSANSYIQETVYEFIASDGILDEVDLRPYPQFEAAFEHHDNYSPPLLLLADIIEENNDAINKEYLKQYYDLHMATILNAIKKAVADNDAAFQFGAEFDSMTETDLEYVVLPGQVDQGQVTLYADATLNGEPLEQADQILGHSRMEAEDPDNNRVFYLDPKTFGGSFMNPPLYIKPLENAGWLGFINIMFPELSGCKPSKSDLIDFEDIQEKIEKSYARIPEDSRLMSDPECIVEKPYHRILERPDVAGIEALITAAIRIYTSTHFLKALPVFTKFAPSFPDNFSSLFASFIIEDMEKSLKDAQNGFAEFFNTFKDEEFWYAFLEQVVQLYVRRVSPGGDIVDIPPTARRALDSLKAQVALLELPTEKEWNQENKAKALFQRMPVPGVPFAADLFSETYQEYKDRKVFEFIHSTQEEAKAIFKELVMEQLNYISAKFLQNLGGVGMKPDIVDMAYYVLEEFAQGSSLTLGPDNFEESFLQIEEGDNQYSSGAEFRTPDGSNYVGYYHSQEDEDGNIIFMAGETHSEDPHDLLTPVDSKIIIPIGDVADLGTLTTFDETKPFIVEKYIKVRGQKYNTDAAMNIIRQSPSTDNISDVYPGNLELVLDPGGKVVGLKGKLGVRYGLQVSAYIPALGEKVFLTDVEIDALDTSIGQMPSLEPNSKLLLCLINHLKDDEKFKLLYRYIFPVTKFTSFTAIYSALSFLPSIGQVSTRPGAKDDSDPANKPGKYVKFGEEDANGNTVWFDRAVVENGQLGWLWPTERSGRPLVNEYDNWDQQLLRNSKRRLKRLFKRHYYGRQFDPISAFKTRERPSFMWLKHLKNNFQDSPGERLLPWWKKRKLRDNPFDAHGKMCKKKD